MRRRVTSTALLLAGCCLLILTACGGDQEGGEVELRVPVAVHEVERGDVEDRITTSGTLRTAESVVLEAETRGVLTIARGAAGRRLAEGDTVRAGQRIAAISGEDARLAAREEATRQRHENARQVLEARRRLFDEGLIAEEELRNAETALVEARLEWEQSQLTEARTDLTTPISGVILSLARGAGEMPMADGQLVSQGFTVARVAPIDELIADVDLVGSDLARVVPGMAAEVRHYAWPEALFPGILLRLAPSIDPGTRAARAEVAVENQQRRLRPGMFVEVSLLARQKQGVALVPREAVTRRGGAPVVFVLAGQRVNRREVVLGLGDDRRVEVVQGIEPGERVVIEGIETLTDGSRVRVTN